MLKRLNILLLFLSGFCLLKVGTCLQAQDVLLDSLKQVIEGANEDSSKVKAHIQIAKTWISSNPQKSLSHFQAALACADQADYHDKDAIIFLDLGRIENDLGHYQKAMEMLDKALKLAKSMDKPLQTGIAHFYISRVYFKQEKLALAMEQLVRAEKIFEEIPNYIWQGDVQTNIGIIYYRQDHVEDAKRHFETALKLHQLDDHQEGIAASHLNLGVINKKLKEYDRALQHYKDALIHFEEAKAIRNQLSILNNLGSLEADRGRQQEAIPYLEKALALCNLPENESQLVLKSYILANLGKAYMEMGLFTKAAPFLTDARLLADSMNLDNLKLIISKDISANLDSLGDTQKALEWMQVAFVLQDSMNQKKQSEKLAQIQTAYRMKVQHEEYEELKREQQLNQLKNIIISIGLLSLIVTAVILFVVYRKKLKNNSLLTRRQKEISEQNSLLVKQNESLGQLNEEKNLMMGMLAQDIRDPLSKIEGLSNILLDQEKLNNQQYQFIGHIKQTVQKLTDMSQRLLDLEALEEGRLSLTPGPINFVEIIDESIAAYRVRGEKKRIQIKRAPIYQALQIWADPRAFRQVLDNLISNAIKFSKTGTEVNIDFVVNEKEVCIQVTDQGPGIAKEEFPKLFEKYQTLRNKPTGGEKSTGLGLALVKKYIEAMNGSIDVESQPGKGTSFYVCFPLIPTTKPEEISRA